MERAYRTCQQVVPVRRSDVAGHVIYEEGSGPAKRRGEKDERHGHEVQRRTLFLTVQGDPEDRDLRKAAA
eukprot:4847326-Pyramimonas_sp.AAC.1